nr:hypothetical protein [Tanacetum cinerariifolium]
MIQTERKGSTQGYPLVSVEVLRTLKDGGEGAACADSCLELLRMDFKHCYGLYTDRDKKLPTGTHSS